MHRPSTPTLLRHIRRAQVPILLRRPDVATIATIFVALQFVIPARYVIGGLGAAGRPSVAIALALGLLWLAWLVSGKTGERVQPVRWVVGAFVAVELLAYAAGLDRGLPAVEMRGALRWLIVVVALSGLALAVADGVPSRRRLDDLLGALVGFTGVMAAVGAMQSLLGFDATQYMRLPGLQLNAGLIGVGARGDGDFARVAGTASHYIEFGVVLAMVLPVAVHRALHPGQGGRSVWRWLLVALIACGIPFSISRSGTVGLAAGLVIMSVIWPWRFRVRALVVAAVGVVVFRVLQPGVLGTIKALFTNTENDPSVQNRIADYAFVSNMFPERPWLGRGPGTFIPDRYILLDNQLLGTLMSSGLLGLAAFLGLFIGGYLTARSIRLRALSPESRHLAQCLAASVVAGLVCSATFDSLSFATFSGLLFLLLGIIGALHRLSRDDGPRPPLQPSPFEPYVASPWMADDTHRRRLAYRSSRPFWWPARAGGKP